MRTQSLRILAFCLLMSTLVLAQEPTPSSANDVSLSVVVTTGDRAVTGLSLKDFRILENQVEQTLISVKENKLVGDYTLTYTPKNPAKDSTFRQVRVEIVHPYGPQMVVRHAQGYRAQPD